MKVVDLPLATRRHRYGSQPLSSGQKYWLAASNNAVLVHDGYFWSILPASDMPRTLGLCIMLTGPVGPSVPGQGRRMVPVAKMTAARVSPFCLVALEEQIPVR